MKPAKTSDVLDKYKMFGSAFVFVYIPGYDFMFLGC